MDYITGHTEIHHHHHHHHHHNNQQQLPPSSPSTHSITSFHRPNYAYPHPPNPTLVLSHEPSPRPPNSGYYEPPPVVPCVPNPYLPHAGYDGKSLTHVYPPVGPGSYYCGPSSGGEVEYFSVKPDPVAYGDGLGRPPSGLQSVVPTNMNTMYQANWVARPYRNGAPRKKSKKKIAKVVQSMYCEVCKIDCNSQDALNSHRQGKKHKKNLEKLKQSITPEPPKSLMPTVENTDPPKSLMPTVENTDTPQVEKGKSASKKKKKAAAATNDDLETKKRRVLEGGAVEETVRVCTLCNVVCNSWVVFDHHVAGQKHAAMVKQQQQKSS